MIRRFRWWIILLILLAVWILSVSHIGRLETCLDGCSEVASRRVGALRVVSLNVYHGFPRFENLSRRLDLIAAEIRRQEADIACLQEVPWAPQVGSGARYLAERSGMNYVYLPVNGNRWAILFSEGETILSRFPLKEAKFTQLEPRAGFFEHRAALQATMISPWGDLRVICTHLTNGAPQVNQGQAASLLDFVTSSGDGMAIVAGDLNARQDSPQIERLARRWVDTYRDVHPKDPGFTCCIDDLESKEGSRLSQRIDYIFLVPEPGKSAHTAGSQIILHQPVLFEGSWQWASDHLGLLTSITLGP